MVINSRLPYTFCNCLAVFVRSLLLLVVLGEGEGADGRPMVFYRGTCIYMYVYVYIFAMAYTICYLFVLYMDVLSRVQWLLLLLLVSRALTLIVYQPTVRRRHVCDCINYYI